jgi:long-chain fatty acid transport protein
VGLSLAVPFGLKTDYGRSTPVRYAATKSYLEVVDLSPAVGFNITKKISLGVGLDMERIAAELDSMATVGPGTDSYGTNKGWGTAYGYHIGSMFQFTPTWRVGFTYNSQVVQHPRGNSRFVGPIANAALGIPLGTPATIYSGETNVHLTLPGYFTLSGFGQVDPKWAVMGTAIYTQWNVIQVLSLQQVSAANAALGLIPTPVPHVGIVPVASTTTTVNLPTHYRNTWNLAAGTEYYATERVTIRGGIGFDETPVVNSYRDVRIPDGNRYAVAMGAHFQATKTLGLDFGYTHLFLFGTTSVNPPPLQDGAQIVTTHGNVTGSADVFGAQLVWDIL